MQKMCPVASRTGFAFSCQASRRGLPTVFGRMGILSIRIERDRAAKGLYELTWHSCELAGTDVGFTEHLTFIFTVYFGC